MLKETPKKEKTPAEIMINENPLKELHEFIKIRNPEAAPLMFGRHHYFKLPSEDKLKKYT